ncbi:hypothetical protein AB0J83_48700 [Actinoplanes sp. NPDC049596]|uniref:hypothetical protein n=1 Tax=unclassified Actinoplanes TaxID=2626549 RepID=UPI003416E295
MDTGDALSGAGFGLVALFLAGSGVRAWARRHRSDTQEPQLQAYARFSLALGCATLAASFLVATSQAVRAVLLSAAIVALLVSVFLENRRSRRLHQD